MTKNKPSPALLAAIQAVQPSERCAAILVADKTFDTALSKLTAWGDFSHSDHVEMAMQAAIAEVTFRFA
jgi:hypothetical protein